MALKVEVLMVDEQTNSLLVIETDLKDEMGVSLTITRPGKKGDKEEIKSMQLYANLLDLARAVSAHLATKDMKSLV